MALTSIYTKNGDTGRASTLTRKNIPKNSPIFELLGTLDELLSSLGVARQEAPVLAQILEDLQKDLMAVSGELAGGKRFATSAQTEQLEAAIDSFSKGSLEAFTISLPGATKGGAALDVARTIARRAERCAVAASQSGGITRDMLAWLNRLSDLLYVMARLCDKAGNGLPPKSAPIDGDNAFCEKALALCREVQRYAAQQGVRVVTAVCDAGGNPVAMLRADDAFIASVDIAVNKAFTSVSLKMTTEQLGKLAQPGESLYGIQFTNNNRLVIFGGGVPLEQNGAIVGGFGVSGGTAAQDTEFGDYAKKYFEKELI